MERRILAPLSLAVSLAALAVPVHAAAGTAATTTNGRPWRVTAKAGATTVSRTEGSVSWTVSLPGRWELPLVTSRGLRGGPSSDGSAIVLAERRAANAGTSSFAVVKDRAVTKVALPGEWSFDAVSPDASALYLTESVGGGGYYVRSIDPRTGKRSERLVTKSIAAAPQAASVDTGPMYGLPLDRVTSPDGRTVFTLYQGPKHPFVHALDIVNGGALCYDLPTSLLPTSSTLHLRLGVRTGLIDVVHRSKVVAQVVAPESSLGPTVLVAGTSREPVIT